MVKSWLCWDIGRALFSKVTLFSLPEVRSAVMGLKYMDPAAGRAHVLRATRKKGAKLFFIKKCTLAAFVSPQRKILATCLQCNIVSSIQRFAIAEKQLTWQDVN